MGDLVFDVDRAESFGRVAHDVLGEGSVSDVGDSALAETEHAVPLEAVDDLGENARADSGAVDTGRAWRGSPGQRIRS